MRGYIERAHLRQGRSLIGTDEVGRGCLAGPVVAACVALDYDRFFKIKKPERDLIRDSKKLSATQRQAALPLIHQFAHHVCIGIAAVSEIEQLGIAPATFLAMRRALAQSQSTYDLLLVDGNQKVAGYQGAQEPIISGDNLVYAIAAASIIAKEHRDQHMREQADIYPNYGFDSHVGYGTKQHLTMIHQHGICPLHRKNFAPIRNAIL